MRIEIKKARVFLDGRKVKLSRVAIAAGLITTVGLGIAKGITSGVESIADAREQAKLEERINDFDAVDIYNQVAPTSSYDEVISENQITHLDDMVRLANLSDRLDKLPDRNIEEMPEEMKQEISSMSIDDLENLLLRAENLKDKKDLNFKEYMTTIKAEEASNVVNERIVDGLKELERTSLLVTKVSLYDADNKKRVDNLEELNESVLINPRTDSEDLSVSATINYDTVNHDTVNLEGVAKEHVNNIYTFQNVIIEKRNTHKQELNDLIRNLVNSNKSLIGSNDKTIEDHWFKKDTLETEFTEETVSAIEGGKTK